MKASNSNLTLDVRSDDLMRSAPSIIARMQFNGRWRDYQQRVLDELDALISDKRLHVVAAPGSGKTVLGLEIVRRLGRGALILSPTRTIRDQWSVRLEEMFLAEGIDDEALSTQLSELGEITSITYQALHAHWKGDDEGFGNLIERLKARGPTTIVLDEAHHLRREWWSALQALVAALPDEHIVALTATPPYDAPFAEWARYEAMCGPIDLEIGIPELVRNGDLCPHQDHIVFSNPGADALDLLNRRRARIAEIQGKLRTDPELIYAIEMHPWLRDSEDHVEQILEAPELLSAMLVLLASAGRQLPKACLTLLGVEQEEVPVPSPFWTEVLLESLLIRFPEQFPLSPGKAANLRSLMHECGLIEAGHVRLRESRSIFTLMSGNLGKLDSIVEIAREEARNLGEKLRLVVLSDHIRAGEISRTGKEEYEPSKLGVVPIFEMLRRAGLSGQRLAILTGSLIVLPNQVVSRLRDLCGAADNLRFSSVGGWPEHLILICEGEIAQRQVQLITQLFCEGELTILVGTQSLLGEGWDAPPINSLVLASNSAAFMLSNQMRGRAIRIDCQEPDKVANIWHLATVEPSAFARNDYSENFNWGALNDDDEASSDLDLLNRRFKAFEGISNCGSLRIEAGLSRLGIFGGPESSNTRAYELARDRSAIADAWSRSLGNASPRAHVREIASPNYAPRGLAWYDTIRWLGASALSAAAFGAANQLTHIPSTANLAGLAMVIAGAATVSSLPFLVRASWLTLRNGSLEGSVEQVARAIVESYWQSGLLDENEYRNATIDVHKDASGVCDVFIAGVTRASEHMLVQGMAEVLGPIQNPRYLLVRRSRLGPFRRTDYHAVPTALGSKKEFANNFHREWKAKIGSSRLLFTRSAEGRRWLLQARARSFAAGFRRAVNRRSAWL